MSASAQPLTRMTLQDFLRWEPGDGQHYELVDGGPRAMAPPSTIHGFLQGRLAARIIDHLEKTKPACSLVITPGVIPHLLSAHNVRIPDLGVTCSPIVPGQTVMTDPVLLVEILSPSNHAETWSNVWTYTSIRSVREILVLYATRIAAELLRRPGEGEWPDRPIEIGAGDDLELESIGFRVAMKALYERTGLSA